MKVSMWKWVGVLVTSVFVLHCGKSDEGAACHADGDCVDSCVAGACVTVKHAGESCTSSQQCERTTVCGFPSPQQGNICAHSCTVDADCPSKNCQPGTDGTSYCAAEGATSGNHRDATRSRWGGFGSEATPPPVGTIRRSGALDAVSTD